MKFIPQLLLTCGLVSLINLSAHALQVDPYQVQLTVWNRTNQTIELNCFPSSGVTMDQQDYVIMANNSPPILLTANQYGNLVHCNVKGTLATFEYTIIDQNKEHVEITKLPTDQPNFHYDSSYPGALTYQIQNINP